MSLTPLCPTCEHLFDEMWKAMHGHAAFMREAFSLMGTCSEEGRRESAVVLMETFNDV
jgi:hypothetical protein